MISLAAYDVIACCTEMASRIHCLPYVGKLWRINDSKVFGEEKFGESVGSILKILAFINIGGENFGELPTLHQIRQNFPPPKFSHVRYFMYLGLIALLIMYIITLAM